MLLLESNWQLQIPHQQSQKYKKPAVKCHADFTFLWGKSGYETIAITAVQRKVMSLITPTQINTDTTPFSFKKAWFLVLLKIS